MSAVPPCRLLSLAVVLGRAPAGHELAVGGAARWRGVDWRLAAVLERTAVLEDPADRWARREVANHQDVLIDPEAVAWRPTDAELLAARRRAARGRAASGRNARRRAAVGAAVP